MHLTALLQDDDAVSPVIGVILMVAITVMLAAVIGQFVFGLSGMIQNSPNAQMTFDYDADASTISSDADAACSAGTGNAVSSSGAALTITHDSGESVAVDRLTIRGSSTVATQDWATCSAQSSGDEAVSGDQAHLEVGSSDSVRVVWTSEDGEQSATLANWDGPDA